MKQKKNRGLIAALILTFILCGILCTDMVMTVQAESENAFYIGAEVLPSDANTYDVRLTVENRGKDWEGVVRLEPDEGYKMPSAYDTALSLPQGSKKQFMVSIPVNSLDSTDGTLTVILLDRKGVQVKKEVFSRILVGQMQSLNMGILSDAYSDLTYLDMGGAELYFYNDLYPIKLVDLRQGNLEDELSSLTFLVIDQYNTDILTSDERHAIESWILGGGVLLLGTGTYAEDTLNSFGSGYLGIQYYEIPEPEDWDEVSGSTGTYVDLSQLATVELDVSPGKYSSIYYDYDSGIWYGSMGSGSVCVLTYSLAELGREDAFNWSSAQEAYVEHILNEAGDYSSLRYSSSSGYDDSGWYIINMLGLIGNNSSILNFGFLKGIVILYVIFVGPVLYLILRFLKRRELYWFAVPAASVLGILLVFCAGRGFEVVSTKVYSVSLKNLSDSKQAGAFLYCYDANRREWDLRLGDDCEYAGPFYNTKYQDSSNDDTYFYHIRREGDTLYLGVDPETNFEDSYFYVGKSGSGDGVTGSFLTQDLTVDSIGVGGTIVNDTNQDMDYIAIISQNDLLYVYENLPAGVTLDLDNEEPLYSQSNSGYHSYSYYSSYIYSFLRDFRDEGEYQKVSELAALGVGIESVTSMLSGHEFIIIGVTDNWNKTVDDDCSETSYGCLYSVQ